MILTHQPLVPPTCMRSLSAHTPTSQSSQCKEVLTLVIQYLQQDLGLYLTTSDVRSHPLAYLPINPGTGVHHRLSIPIVSDGV